MPPPRMTRSGLKTLTSVARLLPSSRALRCSSAFAAGSPLSAATVMSTGRMMPVAGEDRGQRRALAGLREQPAVADQGRPPRHRVEAADVAAAADGVRRLGHRHVADLARQPAGPAVEAAVDDDGRADRLAAAQVDRVPRRRGDGVDPTLAQRGQVHPVVHPHRRRPAGGQPGAGREPVPVGHRRHRGRVAVVEGHRPRHPEADRPQVVPGAGLVEQFVAHALDGGEDRLGPVGDVARLVQGGQQVAGEIGHGDEQLVGRDVHAEDVAGLRAQAQAAGRPAAGRRPEPVGRDQPQRLQFADALGDDAPAEADPLGQHGLRDALFAADGVEDGGQSGEAFTRHGHSLGSREPL